MPLVDRSSYTPPPGFGNGHLQTIFPVLTRKVALITTVRERIETPDGDFLDLDWDTSNASSRLLIMTHGLEGSSTNPYVQAMAAAASRNGWDTLAWNLRGCSGQPNRLARSYHSGATEDLATVIGHVRGTGRYQRIDLVGFSLGGNLTLKYLGDCGSNLPIEIGAAVTFSVPCDLASSSLQLERPMNRIYMHRFLRTLRIKIREKMIRFPNQIHDVGMDSMRTFRQFDDAYTAPLHGFRDAAEYWRKASSLPVLHAIAIPTLLVSARNDPFLARACYPIEQARRNPNLYLEMPASGGHLGFIVFNRLREYWSESRAIAFLTQHPGPGAPRRGTPGLSRIALKKFT